MKSSLLTFMVLSLVLGHNAVAQTDFYSKRWSDVYRYELKVLPKSALAVVDTIYRKAKTENNITQFTKALLYQSKFTLTLEEKAELKIISRLKKEIIETKCPQQNILESILANIYWEYFKDNRWEYFERSRTFSKINPEDFRTWDAAAMFHEIKSHFQKSLSSAEQIQQINLEDFDDILIQAEGSKGYRPTLFDFLSHNALDFFCSDERLVTKPISSLSLHDSRYLDDFENIDLSLIDSSYSKKNALEIFQSLLRFHKKRRDTAAYVHLEIERLRWIVEEGNFERASEIHKQALEKLRTTFLHHSSSTLIDFELATKLFSEGSEYSPNKNPNNQFKKRDALQLCDKAMEAFPDSDGAQKCQILKENILSPKLEVKTESFLPIGKVSRMFIRYNNIGKLSFSVSRIDSSFEDQFNMMNDSLKLTEIKNLSKQNEWSAILKDIQDYQELSTEVVVPSLPPGKFLIAAQVPASSYPFAYAFIQVTNLGLLESSFHDKQRYQVVNRNTGAPIKDADVHLRPPSVNSTFPVINKHYTTNKDGFFEVEKNDQHVSTIQATVTSHNDKAVFGNYYLNRFFKNEKEEDPYSAKTFLFTDRSIYRPGQTVYFKGILIKTKRNKSSVVAGEYVEVFLEDVNSDEVGTLRLKTNSYGSFSGEFKLPASGLTGEYTIYADEDSEDDSKFYDELDDFDNEYLEISVEEYKRPTFEASFNPVKEAFKINDSIKITGNAKAYNGSAISNAKISYHVTRNASYPQWDYLSYRNSYSEPEEISFGEGITNENGDFAIEFVAVPDEDISVESKPIFHYEVTVDVIDINGETRTATGTIKAGYHTMVANIVMQPMIDKRNSTNTVSITSENLNDQYVPIKGKIHVYKLKPPDQPLRARPWSSPDLPLLSEEEFITLFPHDSYGDESDDQQWGKGKLMLTIPFDTEKSKDVKFTTDSSWPIGSYVIELVTTDPDNNEVTASRHFDVFDPENKAVADNQLLIFETNKPSYKIGDVARLKIGSASSDITITIDIERNFQIIKTYTEHLNQNTKEILIPVTTAMTEGFTIHCSGVNYNSFFFDKRNVTVESEREQIEIETVTFKDKIQPGAKETWSFEIKGDESSTKEVEILASMYDASLDQFKPHTWSFNPIQRHQYYSYFQISGSNSFGERQFNIEGERYMPFTIPQQYYDRMDWFGFSITKDYWAEQRYRERLYSSGIDPNNPSKVTMINSRNREDGFIYGTIINHKREPLQGANVIVKGTTRGTITDVYGQYTIRAAKGEVIEFSFIGFATAEAKVGRKNTINVLMEEDILALSEVIVNGYGIEQRKALLSSVVYMVTESQGDVLLRSVNGRMSGVAITSPSYGFASLKIKGASDSDKPLYVVDGMVTDSTQIDHNDLESLSVLKGDAATALYGAKGANGVIIITTKSGQKKIDEEMAKITTRKNFNETAFFFPHINTNSEGKLRFTFTAPEALTRWKLQLLAHTKNLITTTKTLQSVTQKELMVMLNAPRFMRIGDEIILTAKITNLTSKPKEGKVSLQLSNGVTNESIDLLFKNSNRNQSFKVGAKTNTEISWKLSVPTGIDALQYKVLAKAGNFSDGEQNILPILSNRILVTETIPMYVRSGQSKTFNLEKLESTTSKTIENHQLTLQVTSNPAWYAVQALPYLMEFPYECAEQLFSRYYANTIASHIANSNPKIKEVFTTWSSSNAVLSDLEKNQELKSILIQETPWLRDAQSETEQKKRIALLFDLNALKDQSHASMNKLYELQLGDGGFPWFSGGRSSRYITQHIVSGFGHLKHLNIRNPDERTTNLLNKAISFLDMEIVKDFDRISEQADKIRNQAKNEQEGENLGKAFLEQQHIYNDQVQYLYARSYFSEIKIDEKTKPAIEYYRNQSIKYWKNFSLYLKGMIALSNFRDQNKGVSNDILNSLKESSIVSEELGMYWKENKAGWYWHESPIETQALLIEAFAEIDLDNTTQLEKQKTIDELRIWLLKNKQTNQWKTTKATTEAIYALLLIGTDWLSLNDQVEITVGDKKIIPDVKLPEVGTGYFKTTWTGDAIQPSMSRVTITDQKGGIAWGGLYWQYFEELDKITKAETPLSITKKVFVVSRTNQGELLTEVNTAVPLETGDLIRIRIELNTDRSMEFLHMKDMRASGLEPVDVLSEYKWQQGLGYYQSTKDASTNFFFDFVSPGVYVFEYDLRVNNKGNFSNGITTIQSMYAPEFSSHSEGTRMKVE